VDIDESDVDGLMPGEAVTFDVESYPDVVFHGSIRELRLQPVAQQTATTTAVAGSTAGSPATGVVTTVVSYTAIIDVANRDERLRPGMTAEVTLDGARRDRVVRIPNGALAFRPSSAVLQALRETEPSVVEAATHAGDRNTNARNIWTYDGRRFAPVAVHVGLADNQWTELLDGSIRPGDVLVTGAALHRRSWISGQ
jgi:HlyD family secretion protein